MNENENSRPVIIVSGLPRTGTSMMMKMLETGGVSVLVDYKRKPDQDNPKGYYEYEQVKGLKDGEDNWVEKARGKAVKVIATLLPFLPVNYKYKVIFMEREMDEVLASQRKMLINRGEDPNKVSEQELEKIFGKHLNDILEFLENSSNMEYVRVNYNQILLDPRPEIEKVQSFLEARMSPDKMVGVIDTKLYRQRAD